MGYVVLHPHTNLNDSHRYRVVDFDDWRKAWDIWRERHFESSIPTYAFLEYETLDDAVWERNRRNGMKPKPKPKINVDKLVESLIVHSKVYRDSKDVSIETWQGIAQWLVNPSDKRFNLFD